MQVVLFYPLTAVMICDILYLTKRLNERGGDMGIQNTMKALADSTRREILEMLKKSRLSAGEIAEHFTMSSPAVSKHLGILKDAELIRDCREGKYIYYELNASVLEEVMLWMAALKGEKDEERIPDTDRTDAGNSGCDLHTAGSVT